MGQLSAFIANLVAGLLQRAYGSKPSLMLTITGLIGGAAAFVGAYPPAALPAKYQPWLIVAGGFLGTLAGILGHGQGPGQAQNSLGLQGGPDTAQKKL